MMPNHIRGTGGRPNGHEPCAGVAGETLGDHPDGDVDECGSASMRAGPAGATRTDMPPAGHSTTEAGHRSWIPATMTVRTSVAVMIAAIVAGLVVVDWTLLARNERLRRALLDRQMSLYPKAGTVVPSLDGVSADGTPLHVELGGDSRATVLFVFSSTCPICAVNWPYWEYLARNIDRSRYRIVYANLADSLPTGYLRERYFAPQAAVFGTLDPRAVVAYSLSVTPVVAVIDPGGVIRELWIGRSHPDDERNINEALGVANRGSSSSAAAPPGDSR